MALIDHSPRSANCAASGRTVVASLTRATWSKMLHEPTPRGTALRRILCASLTRQLVGANERIRSLVGGPLLTPPTASATNTPSHASKARPSRDLGHHKGVPPGAASTRTSGVDRVEEFDASDSELMQVAGLLEGWRIDRSSLRGAGRATHVFNADQKRNVKQ
jgi:CRP-like cAMP-binding protein